MNLNNIYLIYFETINENGIPLAKCKRKILQVVLGTTTKTKRACIVVFPREKKSKCNINNPIEKGKDQ